MIANKSSTKLTLPTEHSPHKLTVSSSQTLKTVAGILAGVAVIALAIGGIYARKNRGKLLDVLKSFLLGEAFLVASLVLEVLDYTGTDITCCSHMSYNWFAGDAIVFKAILKKAPDFPETQSLVTPGIFFFGLASLASVVSLCVKLKLYLQHFRKRRDEADPLWMAMQSELSPTQKEILTLNSKLVESKTDRTLVWVNLMLALLEVLQPFRNSPRMACK